jgi:hypothetical protein
MMPETPLSMRTFKAFDIFNGDADGILARHQWRLSHPEDTILITGVKRDVALVQRVDAATNDSLTVFDISFDANRDASTRLLERGANIKWFDHHRADNLTAHTNLHAHIDTRADCCTSLIVDRVLNGAHRPWAIAAAYGDNLVSVADALAQASQLSTHEAAQLRALGERINYNAYGETIADLLIAPDALARALQAYASPFDFVRHSSEFASIDAGFQADMAETAHLEPSFSDQHVALFVLPNAAWARRASGVFANTLVHAHPARAHAIASENQNGSFTISIRAPLDSPRDADNIALQFGGGGRKSAAGINAFNAYDFSTLIAAMQAIYK